jgi:hypothetical protein
LRLYLCKTNIFDDNKTDRY